MKEWLLKVTERVWLEGDPNRDRWAGLVMFGTLEIALGIFCFSLAMLLLLVVSAGGLCGMKPVHFTMAMAFLFCLTGWFIVMGMGSIKARRWARALTLVGAWVTVFFGTLALAFMLYILPEAYNIIADSGALSPRAAMVFIYFVTAVLLFLQVVFPLLAVGFYSMKGVKGTCERLNPDPCWSDHIPLPLLAMGFISVLGCSLVFVGATTNYTVLLFGAILSGGAGFFVVLLLAIGFGVVGWGAFKRSTPSWWGAYALVLLTSTSMMLTFSEIEMNALYVHMGYSEAQIESLNEFGLLNPGVLTFVSCIWGVMACIYLVWVRDCFSPEKYVAEVKSYQQRKAEEEAAKEDDSSGVRMRLD